MPLQEVQIMNKSRLVPEGTTKRYREGNFHSSYAVLNELGRGRFAVVRKCKHKESSRQFAAKFVRKRKMGRDCREDILKEIRILESSNKHSRLIGLHEVYETSTEVIIVLEFAVGGELHHYCVAEDSFSERDVVRLLRQILEAVHYLHEQNIAHLDLKPQNILLTSTEPSIGDIRLIDFGIARYLKNGEEIRDIQGTPDYVAPEVLNYEPITLATDMWSIGVLAYVMLTGISPFAGDTKQETFLNISQVNLEFHQDDFGCYSPEAQDFIESLCVLEPEKRLTVRECLDHKWFQKFSEVTHVSEDATDVDANKNTNTHHEESSSTDTSSPTIELVISNNVENVRKDKDDVNENYLNNKDDNALESKVNVLEKLSCVIGAGSGVMRNEHVQENMSDVDVPMDYEGKDGHDARVVGHEEVHGSTQRGEHSFDNVTKARDFPISNTQPTSGQGSAVPPSTLQTECSATVCERRSSCERLHPESQGHDDRSRSPSSSPMGTRRAFCLNKENLPNEIREPKRFCHQVPSQQPGQVVC